jgi:hypothetical protein
VTRKQPRLRRNTTSHQINLTIEDQLEPQLSTIKVLYLPPNPGCSDEDTKRMDNNEAEAGTSLRRSISLVKTEKREKVSREDNSPMMISLDQETMVVN